MWLSMGSAAQSSSASTLLGLKRNYMRALGALLSLAAPTSLKGVSEPQHVVALWCYAVSESSDRSL